MRRYGVPLGLLGAIGLGLAVAVARYAYEGGTNGVTIAATRGVVMTIGLLVHCLVQGRSLRLPAPALWHTIGLGALSSTMLYGLIGAVEYIPVGLAILLFFTFPPIIAVINFVILRDSLTRARVTAVAVAFLGLVLMLGVSVLSVDLRGVALALMAGIATAWNAVWLGRKLSREDGIVVMFYMSLVASTILVAIAYGGGFVVWPTADIGWVGIAGVVVLQGVSVNIYYQVILWIGALKSSIITNIQPLASILAAWILFDEVLTPTQLLGGALVLGGILYMQWAETRGRR